MEFFTRWLQGSDSKKQQVLKYSWCDEVSNWDEHTSAEIVFGGDCRDALYSFLKSNGPQGYQLFLPDDPMRKVEPWISGELTWVDNWTSKKLGTGQSAWICQCISLEGCSLSIYRTLSGSGAAAQPETIWLCELASNPDMRIVDWKIGMGGHRAMRYPFNGNSNQSMLEFLCRQVPERISESSD
jgi:hypothetical protein